jgi:hypothetical protein
MTSSSNYISRLFCDFNKRHNVVQDAPSVWSQLGMDYPPSDNDHVYSLPWERYADIPSIILLGPPRSGKTTEFKHQCQRAQNGFLIELREVDFDQGDLTSAWNQVDLEKWGAFTSSNQEGELFIDSLDEAKLETKFAAKKIINWLKTLDVSLRQRLRVHLSCRELEWNRVDQDQWDKLFSLFDSGKYEEETKSSCFLKIALLPLDEISIASFLSSLDIGKNVFFESLPRFAEQLTQWPQSLRMLAEVYESQGKFDNIEQLYQTIIEIRIQESNEHRVRQINVPLVKRLEIAKFLAAISYLSGREIISLQDVDSDREVDAGLSSYDIQTLKEVTGSELFERFTEGKVRFEDRSIAGFLAAQWLIAALSSKAMTSGKLVSFLYANSTSNEVVPSLRLLAGWLAGLSTEIRQEIVLRSPYLLLTDDYPSELSSSAKESVWNWLKNEFKSREWFGDGAFSSNSEKIVCDEVVHDIEHILKSHKKDRGIRIFAFEILVKGKINRYSDLLLKIILDSKRDDIERIHALRALNKTSPERLLDIKPLLEETYKINSDLELLGLALYYLYPKNLSPEEVFAQFQRIKRRNHYGMFQSFVDKVAIESSDDERAVILHDLAYKLSKQLSAKKKHEGAALDWAKVFSPVLTFDDFLLHQLAKWQDKPAKYPLLERWLHLLGNSKAYGLLVGHSIEKIISILESNTDLRRQCLKLRIERLYSEKGEALKPYDLHLHDQIYQSQADDLEFWLHLLIDWADHAQPKLEVAWEELEICISMAKYPTKVLEWAESVEEDYPVIFVLWKQYRECGFSEKTMKWRREQTARQKRENDEQKNWSNLVNNNCKDIEKGQSIWIENIISYARSKKEETTSIEQWLTERVGENVSLAFSKGLQAYWAASEPIEISIHATNSVPWKSIIILMAVERYLSKDNDWDKIESNLRKKALRAAMWNLNDTPEWFFDAVKLEYKWSIKHCLKVLTVQRERADSSLSLLNQFSGHETELFVQKVASSFLFLHIQLSSLLTKNLLKLLCGEKVNQLNDYILDRLWITGIVYRKSGNLECYLIFMAAIFRFRQEEVWQELNRVHLAKERRVKRFKIWFNALEDINVRFDFGGHWPAWISEKSVSAMTPDMFLAYPPKKDPGFSNEDNQNFRRGDMGRLRDNSFSVLAESGSEFSGRALDSMLSNKIICQTRKSLILHNIDKWKGNQAQNSWIPLKPEDVEKVVNQEHEPIRSSEEFFVFNSRLLDQIRDDIENGEENISSLLWADNNPKIEKEFQKLIARDLRQAIASRKQLVVSGREIEVAGNFPDIFITCLLPNNRGARVFIEIKRQQHREVVDAIENQLVVKYLSDTDTSYGIYIVGWYGQEYFGSYKRILKSHNFGKLPASPIELEKALQSVADKVVKKHVGVAAVRIIVINLEY